MNPQIPPGGRITGPRLAVKLGAWRRGGSRQGAADLAAGIELLVLDGQLPLGTRLPAERELAESLGASRTLIGAALDRLRAGGMVASRRGAGSWITSPRTGGLEPALPDGSELIDFGRASPPAVAGLMPAVDVARRALAEHLGETGYSSRGLLVLRERIARRYTERGLPTTPNQVMITNGAHHALVLSLRLLAGPGDRVLVEQPSYPNALEAIRAAHAIPVPVALDPAGDQGWDLAGIEAALRQAAPRLAYLIVDFQNPTGLRLDTEGRRRLGAILARARTPVVVDETMAELDSEGDPVDGPPPLAAFAGNWAITVGSSAKTYWGGLRIGWIRASEELLGRLMSARTGLDLGSPIFEQLVLAELLAEPETLLRQRRQEVRLLRDAMTGALNWYCPQWSFRVPAGGLSLWCRLPEPMSTRLAVAAGNHGVQLVPASRFGVHGGLERWLRLPFTLPADRLFEGVRRLATAATSLHGTSTMDPDLPVT
ncbi:PLP-dependent aminotransferase family protein [Amycolatopsis nigrescens]|uniref:MocR-like transcription factor YczR n=1 Tax=Amycolatopsis nigrescens TaxID=381445 RepID=UPI000687F2F0|nr:PLP-dependent aminotransferase family protein [Amycolatopsis nigrescens]